MQNRQIDKSTKQVRIDAEIHKWLKVKAAKEGISIKRLIEGYLSEEGIDISPTSNLPTKKYE